ncbi:MAG: response regulator [Sphingomonadales bacterium]|nr:response regulator [Sphingomonadales bacterium]MBD3774690.1 response regulator [Paracoccaceae bacterium]
MIVDDSRMIRSLSRQIIGGFGYQISEAENGEEALARIKAEGMPDLIMIDWNMPVMTGLQCVKALREIAGETWPKIVFCTTNSDATDIHKGIEAGASDWVLKPFDKPALQAKLEKIGAI